MSVSTSQVLPVRDSGQVLAPFVWQRFGGLHLVTVAGPLSVACILQRDDGAWAESGTHRLFVPTGSARAMEHAQEASTWARAPSDASAAAALEGSNEVSIFNCITQQWEKEKQKLMRKQNSITTTSEDPSKSLRLHLWPPLQHQSAQQSIS